MREAALGGAVGDAGAGGVLIHVHMFLYPRAGRTPIDFDASNTSVRLIVLAGGAGAGRYGGGGFMLPSGEPGDAGFGGRIRGATVGPIASAGSFVDRLGSSIMDATVRARHDEAMAGEIASALDALVVVRLDDPSDDKSSE